MIDDSINHEYIIRYLRDLECEPDPCLVKMRAYAKEYAVPIAEPETAAFLRFLCALKQPKQILEIGSAIGYSAITMAMTCDAGIVTIEREPELCIQARRNIEIAGYESRITVLEGDASALLPGISQTFDMVFIDAAKGQYRDFFDKIHIPLGGVVICDNVLYKGMTATDELLMRRKVTIVKRLRSFLDYLYYHPSYETAILPIGDGVAVACKKK